MAEGAKTRKRGAVLLTILLVALLGYSSVFSVLGVHPIQSLLYPLKYTDAIMDSAQRHEVNPYWLCAMIKAESNWNAEATSSAGAVGLMQVLPSTAQELVDEGYVDGDVYSVDDLSDPATNIEFGCAYLRYLVERYHEMQPAIAAYNAGPGTVDAWLEESSDVKDGMDYRETQTYITRVEGNKSRYEYLYPDAFDGYAD